MAWLKRPRFSSDSYNQKKNTHGKDLKLGKKKKVLKKTKKKYTKLLQLIMELKKIF